MDISHIEFITTTLTPWHWMTIGVLLCALELFAPTTILLWPGIAAVITGFITLLLPALSWQVQVALWAILAVATAFAGRQFYKRRATSTSTLNKRADKLIGRTITVSDPIDNGVGSTFIDGTRWRIIGPDTASGERMTITALDGASLVVNPATESTG